MPGRGWGNGVVGLTISRKEFILLRHILITTCLFVGMSTAWSSEPGHALYDHEDPAAFYLQAPPGGKAGLRKAINASLQRDPRNVAALVQRAYDFKDRGDLPRAVRDFDAALTAAEPGSANERHVLWSRGWVHYDLGDAAAALRDWQRAAELHKGRPRWVTYSYALAYGTMGQMGQAIGWYDAAVAAMPEWGSEAGFAERTKHWRDAQRSELRVVFEAWQVNVAAGTSSVPAQAAD
ncbi:tetratricopeptide repeat protein [Lysobacter sp. CFH 32150]|uniref:tetratricopeptide repeat protein n=1 Tax=Lysobacter sp. CFH 32150 TaxID=2927128 RepID=UPI001FA81386|nr:tetratricopeptide repeat protein [Lysobacter sp. CFH 32150]MCI4567668.1 tetratricopeptide repeat protein [Lysobacter sp. CFH 32150]